MAHTYKNAKVDLTSTGVTTFYTVPDNTTTIVKSILVSEDAGSTPTLTITLTNGDNVFNLFKTKALTANGTLEFLTSPLVITAGEILKVTASAANQLHVVGSLLEIT
jgi:hypothetical protein|tara:strand:+ start:108 stop:428 length:321 start_codon:yes stop_codon:yes gene_type:complete